MSLSFAYVQAQGNNPMVALNPPVHRPSITNPFHIIPLDKKMVYLVLILGAWMVPSRLCVAILPTTHAPASGSFTKKRRQKCKLVKPKDCVEFAPTKVIVRYTNRPAHTITTDCHCHAGYARRDYCWCRSQPQGCHDRRLQSIAEERRRILRVQPAVCRCRAHTHSRETR